jgi:hypothetical protein
MGWLSKLFGQKEKPEVEEEKSEEETENPEEETPEKKSISKRSKKNAKASTYSDVAKSTYIPVPEEDVNLVASSFGMLRPDGVAAALYIDTEQMTTKPFVVYGIITCVCTDVLPISLSVIPGLHTEHAITCPNCNTKISGSKGAMENFVIVTAGIDEVSQQYKFEKIKIMLYKLTNI